MTLPVREFVVLERVAFQAVPAAAKSKSSEVRDGY
jgi:hypothetical protein